MASVGSVADGSVGDGLFLPELLLKITDVTDGVSNTVAFSNEPWFHRRKPDGETCGSSTRTWSNLSISACNEDPTNLSAYQGTRRSRPATSCKRTGRTTPVCTTTCDNRTTSGWIACNTTRPDQRRRRLAHRRRERLPGRWQRRFGQQFHHPADGLRSAHAQTARIPGTDGNSSGDINAIPHSTRGYCPAQRSRPARPLRVCVRRRNRCQTRVWSQGGNRTRMRSRLGPRKQHSPHAMQPGSETKLTTEKGSGNFYRAKLPEKKKTVVVFGVTEAGGHACGDGPALAFLLLPKGDRRRVLLPKTHGNESHAGDSSRARWGQSSVSSACRRKPVPEVEVTVGLPGADEDKAQAVKTDKDGLTVSFSEQGRYCVVVRRADAKSGGIDSKKYAATRHTATLVCDYAVRPK